MEQTLQQVRKPLTREEVWRRLEANRQSKREFVERAKRILSEEYKKRTGKEPEGFTVW